MRKLAWQLLVLGGILVIKSIELTNWRSHKKSSFAFSSGTNFLVGIMGSGKSSVMDALCYAFFGTFPSLRRGKVTLKDVLLHGSNEDGSVKLEFEFEKSSYAVHRIISSKGVTADSELYQDGKLIEKSPKAVTSRICSILRVDYDLFTRAIYCEQNKVDHVLSLDPRRRKQEIDELLGLDKFERARAAITTVINRLEGTKQALEQGYTEKGLEAQKEEKLKSERELEKTKEQIKALSASLGVCSKELVQLQQAYETESRKKTDFERHSALLVKLEGERAALVQSTGGLDQAALEASLAQAASGLEKESIQLKSAKSALSVLDGELSQISSKAGFLKSQQARALAISENIARKKAEIKQIEGAENKAILEGRLASANAELESHLKLQAVSQSIGEEAAKAIQAISGTEAACPVCSKPLEKGESEHIKKEKMGIIENAKKLGAEAAQNASTCSAQIRQLQSRLNQLSGAQSLLSGMESELASASNVSRELEGQFSLLEIKSGQKAQLNAQIASIQNSFSAISVKKSQIETQLLSISRLASVSRQIEQQKQSLALLSYSAGSIEAARDLLEKCRIDIARIESSLSLAAKSLESLQALCLQLSGDVGRLEAQRAQLADFVFRHQQALILKNSIELTQLAVRNEYITAVNSSLEEIWNIVYPYGDIKKVRLSVDGKDYYFEALKDRWHQLEAIASGGERACLALSLRIAFATVLTPNLSWIILDEPTHNLDSDAVSTLAVALEDKIPLLVQQVFVITHDSALVEEGKGNVYTLSRNKANNEPTKLA
ncbi:SMC family ATPase [Candidatus Parvarchaeota archaeon]|nr:SMC family ATPase [Candidatus Parvarchaeota archaeon]